MSRPMLSLWRCFLPGLFYYSPLCKEKVDFSVLRDLCESALDEQAILFGYPLRRRLVVYLFAFWREITVLCKRPVAGLALGPANAIVLGADDALSEPSRTRLVTSSPLG